MDIYKQLTRIFTGSGFKDIMQLCIYFMKLNVSALTTHRCRCNNLASTSPRTIRPMSWQTVQRELLYRRLDNDEVASHLQLELSCACIQQSMYYLLTLLRSEHPHSQRWSVDLWWPCGDHKKSVCSRSHQFGRAHSLELPFRSKTSRCISDIPAIKSWSKLQFWWPDNG